jgi:transglutaminase-like putative cysteine protease
MTLALRLFSLCFLTWHLGLYFPSLLEPQMMVVLVALAFSGGIVTSRFRGLVSSLLAVAFWLSLRLLLVALPQAASTFLPENLVWDTVPLWADRHLFFTLPTLALAWAQGWWVRPGKQLLGAERLLNAAVLVGLFWAQGPFHLTLYSSPFLFALVLLPYLASEALLLITDFRGVSRATLSGLAGLLALLLSLGALLWSQFDTYEELSTASGGGLMKPDLFQFDFSPLVRLESEISLSDHLVLLYREPGPEAKRYLRRFVLSGYDPAKGFFVDPPTGGSEELTPPVGRKSLHFPANEKYQDRQLVSQQYYLVNLDPSSLLALNAPTLVQPYAKWNKSSFVNAYRVESRVPNDLYWELADATSDGLGEAERKHDLFWGTDLELKALALKITKQATNPYEKAVAIQNWLKSNYMYSLKPGSPGPEGALKHFLFVSKKGYCSYFAFSMALLLRSVGIPARVSVGFFTNPQEKLLDFYPVRAFQAHAWVEVPFENFGWIEFDPTSETLAPGEGLSPPKAMDPDEMNRMIGEILQAQAQPLTETAEISPLGTPDSALKQLGNWASQFGVLFSFLAALLVQEGYRYRYRLSALVAGPRHRALSAWRELRWRALQAGRGPLVAETPSHWAQRTGLALEVAVLTEKARYAEAFSDQQASQTWQYARMARNHLRAKQSLPRRWLYALFPWWPAPRQTP